MRNESLVFLAGIFLLSGCLPGFETDSSSGPVEVDSLIQEDTVVTQLCTEKITFSKFNKDGDPDGETYILVDPSQDPVHNYAYSDEELFPGKYAIANRRGRIVEVNTWGDEVYRYEYRSIDGVGKDTIVYENLRDFDGYTEHFMTNLSFNAEGVIDSVDRLSFIVSDEGTDTFPYMNSLHMWQNRDFYRNDTGFVLHEDYKSSTLDDTEYGIDGDGEIRSSYLREEYQDYETKDSVVGETFTTYGWENGYLVSSHEIHYPRKGADSEQSLYTWDYEFNEAGDPTQIRYSETGYKWVLRIEYGPLTCP